MVEFEENMKLVYFVYNNKFSKHFNIKDDLIQVGLIALWKATKKFDEAQNLKFSSYAVKSIVNAMISFIQKENKYYARIQDVEDLKCLKIAEESGFENKILFKKQDFTEFEERMSRMYSQGYTIREVAKELGMSHQYIQMRLKKLKNKLYIEK